MNEEIYESNDNDFLHYIFYQLKHIKVKNLHTLQEKIKTLDLAFFEELEKHSAGCTMDCWDFLLDATARWEKPEREEFEGDEDYEHHLSIYKFFLCQENRLKDEFLSKNNMQQKDWEDFAKKTCEKCEKCDEDEKAELVCENNCPFNQWVSFSYRNSESIQKDLFYTIFKPLSEYHMNLYKTNSLKLSKIYLKWKKKGYEEINVLHPLEDMPPFEDEEDEEDEEEEEQYE